MYLICFNSSSCCAHFWSLFPLERVPKFSDGHINVNLVLLWKPSIKYCFESTNHIEGLVRNYCNYNNYENKCRYKNGFARSPRYVCMQTCMYSPSMINEFLRSQRFRSLKVHIIIIRVLMCTKVSGIFIKMEQKYGDQRDIYNWKCISSYVHKVFISINKKTPSEAISQI